MAHTHLAWLESKLPASSTFTLVTQNVDGLHRKAGSRNLLEIHGRLPRTRCSDPSCSFQPLEEDYSYDGTVPKCPVCGMNLRLDIVLFGEELTLESHQAKVALRNVDLFVAIGTSGTVVPASGFVRSADYAGARTVYLNAEPMDPPNPYFQEQYIGKAEDLVPAVLKL